jgi:Protein of unknown function (DUF2752)
VRLIRRPLIPGEPDPEFLWGSVLAASALVAAGWLYWRLPTPLCPLHAVTGLPCPTCGSTRAASALVRGDLAAALTWNPLMTLVMIGAALYVLYAAVVVIGNLPRLRWTPPSRSESRGIRIGVILLIAVNWGYLIWRGV